MIYTMFLFDNFVLLTNIIVGRSDYEQTGCEEDDEKNVNTGRMQRNRRRLTLGIPCILLFGGIIFLIIMILTGESDFVI